MDVDIIVWVVVVVILLVGFIWKVLKVKCGLVLLVLLIFFLEDFCIGFVIVG